MCLQNVTTPTEDLGTTFYKVVFRSQLGGRVVFLSPFASGDYSPNKEEKARDRYGDVYTVPLTASFYQRVGGCGFHAFITFEDALKYARHLNKVRFDDSLVKYVVVMVSLREIFAQGDLVLHGEGIAKCVVARYQTLNILEKL